jgi:hypothetical protein
MRWLATLFIALAASACTINVKSPKVAFSEVGKAERGNNEVSTAHNTAVLRGPGFTLSAAGTYLTGQISDLPTTEPEFFFERHGRGTYTLDIGAIGECRASPTAKRLLSEALAKVWNYSGGFPSKGGVDVHVIGANVRVARYNLSLRKGREYHLQYWTPCVGDDPDAALFFGATIALHETTHASLDMVDGESKDAFERERIAVGAEACLYLAVRNLNEAFTQQHEELLAHFHGVVASRLGTTHIELATLCKAWMASVSATKAH